MIRSLTPENTLHTGQKAWSAIRCIKTYQKWGQNGRQRTMPESTERHKVGGVVVVCRAQHQPGGVLLSHSFVDRLFADG